MITRNIKDFKDFMECIKSGKVVRINGGKYGKYTFEDGYIVWQYEDGCKNYNSTVNDYDLKYMTVEEHEPMKIEVEKFYKTREGKKAFVYSIFKGDKYPVKAVIINDYRGVMSYDEDGFSYNNKEPSIDDLVAPWEEL